ncbi:transglycosylase SLT domain-containing protein [Parasphingorhabdus halotolerans]|uniref:Transglycosylase SLT domain-containing protein n=1 Tax=Parasphingorhabdus halotolerans TaxID=2725558 RepID=A0A6H2DQF0_9SPHN|nr:transglycosylase SLT domain-containing protein [Parasphingorhabdus halotolerans]QJB70564.1 transglycosylase SLT domain-containing protein [Parasphingorhabdus halotolerans]
MATASVSLRIASRITIAALLLTPAACMAAEQLGWQESGGSDLSDPTGGNAQLALQRWRVLTGSDNYSFEDYAGFLVTYPGWPDDTRMQRNAEQAININSFSPDRVIAFFSRFEPITNAGAAKFAVALQAKGDSATANQWAKNAWRGGTLTDEDEAALISRFSSALTIDDHDTRMDALLWARATRDAARQISFTSGTRRPVFEARLAQLTESPSANALASAVGAIANDDAGYLADRARYLRNQGQSASARQLLANRPELRVKPVMPETWFEAMLLNAEAAQNDNQWSTAYNIASKLDDAYATPTDIAKENSRVRDKYSDLAWIAGTSALNGLRQPDKAIGMFDRYARSYDSPNIRSKGYYWAGRAAAEAGQSSEANAYFEKAAQFPAYFYGQLAHERLGRALPKFNRTHPVEITDQDRRDFDNQPLVVAARSSARSAPWKEQIRFYRALAFNAKTPKDYALISDLSARIGQRDMGVIAGISSIGAVETVDDSTLFPTLPVPFGYENSWTTIHAITRQESQFAQGAISHAGARGLMQLMPGTAREQAGKNGLSYNISALTDDPQYNIKLGSGYFERMLDYYGGSHPLAVAAYNAGPGNVNKWLRANGDPRMGGIDWVKWIEDIPISETRNYVKRVLENAVVYDTLNPRGPKWQTDTPLTRYIGKNYKG